MELFSTRWDQSDGWSAPLPDWDGPSTLVFAFGASSLLDDRQPVRELVAAYPTAPIVGCSTAGEILGDGVYDDGLTVAVARFATTRITLVTEQVDKPGDSHAAGLSLGERLMAAEPAMKSLFVLSDGLAVNGTALVNGLVEGTGGTVIITGGLAGDGDRFSRSWIIADGDVQPGYISAVGLAGPDLGVGFGSRGGWGIFGPQRRVTRSIGNVLYELDGQPALELYKKYLGDRAGGLPATALLFPLAVRAPGADERELVRTILAVDEADQSMTFAGDVPEGSLTQLMRADFDRLVDGAFQAGSDAASGPEGPALAIAVSCVGRRLVLGRETEDEIEATLSALREGSTLVGFYSYGEICSIATGTCDLHNQTMTVTTIWETV